MEAVGLGEVADADGERVAGQFLLGEPGGVGLDLLLALGVLLLDFLDGRLHALVELLFDGERSISVRLI